MSIFGHHIPSRLLWLAAAELLLIYACLNVTLLWLHTPLAPLPSFDLEVAAAAVAVMLALMLAGLYEHELLAIHGTRSALLRLIPAVALALLLWLLYHHLTHSPVDLPLTTGAAAGAMVIASLALERRLFCALCDAEVFRRRILVLGCGTRAQAIDSIHPEKGADQLPYRVVAYIATAAESPPPASSNRILRLDSHTSLLELARSQKADEIVIAVRDRRQNLPIQQLLDCKLRGIAITELSSFFERESKRLELDSLNASWMVIGKGFRQHWLRNSIKRLFDLTASSLLLLVTLPVLLTTAIAIKLDSPGPVLFRQIRVGLGGVPFAIYKFRSMREDAEHDGVARWATGNDERVTRVGRVIRKLRIDELPQIINVFQGTMSFVGPRPERPIFVEQLCQQIPFFPERHSIPPGITGWAQVRYPYGASVEDARQKLQYDLYYLKNHTLFLDLVILFETVKVVLFGRGAR